MALSEQDKAPAGTASASSTPAKKPDGSTYNRVKPVTFEVWQTDLAFDRGNGAPRETIARTKDAVTAYDNYVSVWNSSTQNTRFAIDQQHGFFGGEMSLAQEAEAAAETTPAVVSLPTPPPVVDPLPDPDPTEISPKPEEDSTNQGGDKTPTDGNAADDELVDVEEKEEMDPSQETSENDEDDSLLTVRDVTPSNEVIDPLTGEVYPSPQDARLAGITNWVWLSDYKGE